MAIVISITNQWSDGQRLHVTGTMALSGTYAAGGEAAVFTNAIDARPGFIGLMTTNLPDLVRIEGISGFVYKYAPGTGKVLVYTGAAAQSPLTQLANGAYPAGIGLDVIDFYAIFKKY